MAALKTMGMDALYLDFSNTSSAVSHIIPIARFVEILTADVGCKVGIVCTTKIRGL